MAFREVSVTQVREVLRRWLRDDEGLRLVAAGAGVDRKTVRRYVDAAVALVLDRLCDREGGRLQSVAGVRLVPGGDLGLDERAQEVLRAPPLGVIRHNHGTT